MHSTCFSQTLENLSGDTELTYRTYSSPAPATCTFYFRLKSIIHKEICSAIFKIKPN